MFSIRFNGLAPSKTIDFPIVFHFLFFLEFTFPAFIPPIFLVYWKLSVVNKCPLNKAEAETGRANFMDLFCLLSKTFRLYYAVRLFWRVSFSCSHLYLLIHTSANYTVPSNNVDPKMQNKWGKMLGKCYLWCMTFFTRRKK